jgi:hypothetical protein
LLSKIKIKTIQEPQRIIEIPLKTMQEDLYENVSEINGIAIPAYYEKITTGKMTIEDIVNSKEY